MSFFFSNDTPTTEIYTLSLHDALPISSACASGRPSVSRIMRLVCTLVCQLLARIRSEEHTSELQSRFDLVCRLLLEKKKRTENTNQFVSHEYTRAQV